MAAYDDRPISVYDNLSTPASTPKSKAQPPAAETITATTTTIIIPLTTTSPATTNAAIPATTTNGAANSPYTNISFKFNDNNNMPPQQQQQSYLLPSNNRSLNSTSNQLHPATMTGNSSNYTYATPFKPTTALTNTPTAAAGATTTTATTYASIAPTQAEESTSAIDAFALTNASPAPRPLSQYSQSDLNEATSQSIAAVKAALNDAKSKFFGLNGYASQNENNWNNNHHHHHHNNNNNYNDHQTYDSHPIEQHQYIQPLLYDPNNADHAPSARPKVQILTPPPKPQPKYQNIPENSAIFRNLTPPERPPKPSHLQTAIANFEPPPSSSSASSSPPSNRPSEFHSDHQHSPSPSKMSSYQQPTTSGRSGSFAAYKQLPLNDIDSSTPSQAVYMSTTVPQNIKGTKIAGRHTPTRNSLRHSRMIVVHNKNFQGDQHPNPMNFKYPNLARWLLIFQIIIGCLLLCVATWAFLLAPNTAIQDNPYWSGIVLLLAGILGLSLIRYRRNKRQKVRENCFLFLKGDSYILSLAAVLLCCVAMIFAAIHFTRLIASDTICESSNILQEHGSCLCTFNAPTSILEAPSASIKGIAGEDNSIWLSNGQRVKENLAQASDESYKVEYRDLSCEEVTCEWTSLLGVSMSLNALGLLISFIYIVLLACHRYNSKRQYSSVQTSTF